MWHKSESVGIKPPVLDTTSSKKNVYIRKDYIKRNNEDGNDVWSYLEQQISKDDWQIYTKIIENNSIISELNEAIFELAEIITEV